MDWTAAWRKINEHNAEQTQDWVTQVRNGLIDLAKETICTQIHKKSHSEEADRSHAEGQPCEQCFSIDHLSKEQSLHPHDHHSMDSANCKHRPTEEPDLTTNREYVTPRKLASVVNERMHEDYASLHVRMTAAMLAQSIELIRQIIISTRNGTVSVRGLGEFKCRTFPQPTERGEDGRLIQRVTFRPASVATSIAI
ncbi:hypothetical protein DBV39_01275 [Orrella marina]|uniref:Uncharacterized protein n=1 Tax=Orrella marina TaxID=2163011 RepID=A0A2R4XFM4_9BURK|nr:hypothetical protein DBV39_01275 [Orrella marina]